MEINKYEVKGITVVEIEGDLMGGPGAMSLNDLFHELIENGQIQIIADLGKVNWINSSGLGILTGSLANLRNNNGDLILVNLTDRIENLLKITKLNTVFKTYDSVEMAVENYQ